MKILLVNDYATRTGGAEVGILMLRDALRDKGHDARLFASSARPGGSAGQADYLCHGTTSRFRTLLQTCNPWAGLRLARVLRDFKPDVVHVKMFLTQLSPLVLPLLRQVPSLYHVVWYRPVCPLGTKMLPDGAECRVPAGLACLRNHCLPVHDWAPLMLQMRLWRRWRRAFDLVVANSEAVRRALLADGIEPVEVVWSATPHRAPRTRLASQPTVTFAGRLVREKGLDVLLSAFQSVLTQVPGARLVVAGEGPEGESLRRLAATSGLGRHVSFLGHLEDAALDQALDSAWVQAVPSRWAEPFGLVAIEAMMQGIPVVVSNSGGLCEIVQDGRGGLLVPPDRPGPLAEALVRILGDRGLAERMGKEAREVALERFGSPMMVDRFLRLYEGLMDRKGTTHVAS